MQVQMENNNMTWENYHYVPERCFFIKAEPIVKPWYLNHTTYHHGDSGLDLFTPDNILFEANEKGKLVDLKIACEFYDIKKCNTHHKYDSYYLYPRSSISKTPLRLSNSVGIIDSGYRGNLIMALDNISSEKFVLEKGSRIVQICAGDLQPFKFKVVEQLSETSRGSGGFGSTNQMNQEN